MSRKSRWVCWHWYNGDKENVPFNPVTGRDGFKDKESRTSFDRAFAEWQAHPDQCHGVGIVLAPAMRRVVLDFDKCRDRITGRIDDAALEIARFFDSYTDISPSATGFKIFIQAIGPGHDKVIMFEGQKIEVLSDRFVTVTGQRHLDFPASINERQAQLDSLLANAQQTHRSPLLDPNKEYSALLSDDEVI